jgi:hypothetical protein
MQDIHLADETFDPNQTHNYHLLVQLGQAELTYCLLNTITKKFVLLHHFAIPQVQTDEKLISTLNSETLFKSSYKKISVITTGGKNTLVPEAFFDEQNLQQLANFNLGEVATNAVAFNKSTTAGLVDIFTNDHANLCDAFLKLQPSAKVYHRTLPFLNYITLWPSRGFRFDCFAVVNSRYVDFGVVQNRKLEFFNSFECQGVNDMVYYILKASEPFGRQNNNFRFYVSTDISNQNELFDQLNNYLPDIKFIKPSEKFTYSYLFDDLYLTRYANLFNLALCE